MLTYTDNLPDDDTQPAISRAETLESLTLREAWAVYLSIVLLAPAPVGCAAYDSVDGVPQVFGQLFDHLRQHKRG